MSKSEQELKEQTWNDIKELHDHWKWYLAMGALMVLLGFIGIGSSMYVTKVLMKIIGLLILGGGIVQTVSAFWTKKWGGLLLQLLIGLLYIVIGSLLMRDPVQGRCLVWGRG